MALFLETVSVKETQRAVELGFVWGATTNTAVIAQTGRDPVDIVSDLCELLPGNVVCQLSASTTSEREAEALRMVHIDPTKVGVSVPCTTENLGLIASLTDEGITCGVASVFSPNQAYLACEAGAHFVLPCISRINSLQGDGPGLVSAILAVIEAAETGTEILATDLKTPADVTETVLAGAHHLSLTLGMVMSLGEHPLSRQINE